MQAIMDYSTLIIIGLTALNVILCLVMLFRSGGRKEAEVIDSLDRVGAKQEAGMKGVREEIVYSARQSREEMNAQINQLGAALNGSVTLIAKAQNERLDAFSARMAEARTVAENQGKAMRLELSEGMTKLTAEQMRKMDSFTLQLGEQRRCMSEESKALRDEVTKTLAAMATQLSENAETLRRSVEGRLDMLRSENTEKLEQMRVTVDEKLQGTLEQRLGASFTQVNENLERVYKSVGEMQTIASGVGDLKRILSNVKSRGTWGETTLGMLLEQVLTPDQYGRNVEVKPGTGQRVEFAVRLPGESGEAHIWLPIDAKFPTTDYERLAEASERGDAVAVEEAVKAIERAIRGAAKDIRDKYVSPPHSTDFGVMFLPTEGLFAEAARRPGLLDALQRDYRVVVAGPTTLMALLTSLRMGFRSLAIQKRSGEVWQVLGAVKTEFGKFGDVLDKVHKKLHEAQNVVETAGVRRRAVDRQLRSVEALSEDTAQLLLGMAAAGAAQDWQQTDAENEAALNESTAA